MMFSSEFINYQSLLLRVDIENKMGGLSTSGQDLWIILLALNSILEVRAYPGDATHAKSMTDQTLFPFTSDNLMAWLSEGE